jgi:hypothetical protein
VAAFRLLGHCRFSLYRGGLGSVPRRRCGRAGAEQGAERQAEDRSASEQCRGRVHARIVDIPQVFAIFTGCRVGNS